MKPFQLLIALDAVEFVERRSRLNRVSIREQLTQLRDFPGNYSADAERDSTGRLVDISLCGRFAVKL